MTYRPGPRRLPFLLILLLLLQLPAAGAREEKQAFDLSSVRWSLEPDASLIYDGTEKEVTLLGLPEGLAVAYYEGNRGTFPGQREARASFSYDQSLHKAPQVPPLTWRILAPPPPQMALAASREGVRISWTLPRHADGVEIYRTPLGQKRLKRIFFGSRNDTTEFLDRDAVIGQGYAYTMRVFVDQPFLWGLYRKYHYSEFGPAQVVVMLEKPTGLKAERLPSGEGFALSWDAVEGAAGYLITREDQPAGQQAPLTLGPVRQPACQDSQPLTGDYCYYRVAACLWAGNEPRSGPMSDPICQSGRPDTGLAGDADNNGRVDIQDLICLSDYLTHGLPCPSMGNADASGSGQPPGPEDLVLIAIAIVGR